MSLFQFSLRKKGFPPNRETDHSLCFSHWSLARRVIFVLFLLPTLLLPLLSVLPKFSASAGPHPLFLQPAHAHGAHAAHDPALQADEALARSERLSTLWATLPKVDPSRAAVSEARVLEVDELTSNDLEIEMTSNDLELTSNGLEMTSEDLESQRLTSESPPSVATAEEVMAETEVMALSEM